MTDDKITNFNLTASIFRMENILKQMSNDYYERDRIPSPDGLNYKDGCHVSCAVLCVDIRDSSLPTKHTTPVLAKIYRAYISELIALIKSCKLHRHVRIDGDAVMGIFDVPTPAVHLNEIFELAAKASSLIHILNYKLEKQGYTIIRVGIGLSFGRVLMVKAGCFGSGYNDIVWMGDAVNRASKLSGYGNKEQQNGDQEVMVSKRFHEKLQPVYRGYLSWSQYRQCYTGRIWDIAMEKFCEEMKKPPKPKPAYIPPPTIFNSPPPNYSHLPFSLSPPPNSLVQLADILSPQPLFEHSDITNLFQALMKK